MTTTPGRTICWTPIWNKSLEGVGLKHLLLTKCAADSVVLAVDEDAIVLDYPDLFRRVP